MASCAWGFALVLGNAPEHSTEPGSQQPDDVWSFGEEPTASSVPSWSFNEGESTFHETFDSHENGGIGEVMTGSFRLLGAFLHFDDPRSPLDDDGLAVSVGRLMFDQQWEVVDLEINIFTDISRTATGARASPGTFTAAGATQSVYRGPYLNVPFWSDGAMNGTLGVDRAALSFGKGIVSGAIGRFPINYSVANLITPNDFFAPFSATAVNRIYKPGVDAATVALTTDSLSSIEVVGALGFEDGDAPSPTWGRSAVLARASTVQWGFEWAALGGKLAERWVAGGSLQGNIEWFTLRGEGHLGIPDLDGNGHGEDDLPLNGRLAVGPGVTFGWHNANLTAEYAYYSDGARDPADYLARAKDFFPDDLPYVGRHYVGVSGGLDILPILRTGVVALVDAGDGSSLTGLNLMLSVADEAVVVAGVLVPGGAGLETTGVPTAPLALGSEFGSSPAALFLESRVFF